MTWTVGDVVGVMDEWYPPQWAASWDAVGLVVGEPSAPVQRVLCVMDVVPETVAEAVECGAQLMIAHHPLLFGGVTSVAATSYKGRVVQELIRAGIALHVAHTNADIAADGVNEALAECFGLIGTVPVAPRPGRPDIGLGRVGMLPVPMTLAELTRLAARVLPATAWGVRTAGDPDKIISRVAVLGGSGSDELAAAASAGADAVITSDIKHHYASEHIADGGPALVEAAHWATEWPWLPRLGAMLHERLGVETIVSRQCTDAWTLHEPSTTAISEGIPA
ncbi:dinuclear metal center YbgI/SA1388 family protein [Allocatelliglobosispora scoriae]|uniref:GTP cyclohydrolase 1 type 2 homolog n=1 Tax=Allocatelliglobosispora scoriae TaxID=643052 RepID=A0A841BSX7_9ACTN|nr:Nif3-like dinuclear metal center hexameric protein [Allocatelliglobosispora scoriae]MBB5869890.1 dinuclear metal center YbgI/SA1388 family protein [Allocatelliglobosispora scoriae]